MEPDRSTRLSGKNREQGRGQCSRGCSVMECSRAPVGADLLLDPESSSGDNGRLLDGKAASGKERNLVS